jgi:formate/nitrite transporter FocA (FNT family)
MKKLLKVMLPPFIGFFLYFIAIRYSSLYFTLQIDKMGVGDLKSFMAFYRYTLPLLFVVAVLTQLLVVVPVWNSLDKKTVADKINIIVDLCFICLVFALGISYSIWDPQHGIGNLVKLVGFMSAVQIIYWFINLLILYLLADG